MAWLATETGGTAEASQTRRDTPDATAGGQVELSEADEASAAFTDLAASFEGRTVHTGSRTDSESTAAVETGSFIAEEALRMVAVAGETTAVGGVAIVAQIAGETRSRTGAGETVVGAGSAGGSAQEEARDAGHAVSRC